VPADLLVHTREILVVSPQGGNGGTGELSDIEGVTLEESPHFKGCQTVKTASTVSKDERKNALWLLVVNGEY
jgi:hypothetical protein